MAFNFNAAVLRDLIKKENISEAELARRIGVSRACVNRIVREQRTPSAKVIAGIKAAFPQYPLEKFFE